MTRRYPPRPNPQFTGTQTLTLEEWEEKGRPRTDFMNPVGRHKGTDPHAYEKGDLPSQTGTPVDHVAVADGAS